MKRAALLIAAMIAPAASPAGAGPNAMAHRPAIERLPFTGDLTKRATCVTRWLGRSGNTRQYVIPDGYGVDLGMGGSVFFQADGPAILTIEFHKPADGQFMRVLYRHPFSAKYAIKLVRDQAKPCFADDWNRWAAENGAKPVTP